MDLARSSRLDTSDSLFVIQLVRRLGKLNWWTFEDYSAMYAVSNDEVEYVVTNGYYDTSRNRMIAWVAEIVPNAKTLKEYYPDDLEANRICPNGPDTVVMMSAVIGYRTDSLAAWHLFPFEHTQVVCASSLSDASTRLARYYFNDMKIHSIPCVTQSGGEKGMIQKRPVAFNLDEARFWVESPLWMKDTVCADGLYPFEVKSYGHGRVARCFKCAKPYDVPN